jgi:hypothetical protein
VRDHEADFHIKSAPSSRNAIEALSRLAKLHPPLLKAIQMIKLDASGTITPESVTLVESAMAGIEQMLHTDDGEGERQPSSTTISSLANSKEELYYQQPQKRNSAHKYVNFENAVPSGIEANEKQASRGNEDRIVPKPRIRSISSPQAARDSTENSNSAFTKGASKSLRSRSTSPSSRFRALPVRLGSTEYQQGACSKLKAPLPPRKYRPNPQVVDPCM